MKALNKKGVSLSELLAVVVIMGIIAAIAIPLVGNIIDTTKKNAWISDATAVTSAFKTYCQINFDDQDCTNNDTEVRLITFGDDEIPTTANKFSKFISKSIDAKKYSKFSIKKNGNEYEVAIAGNGYIAVGSTVNLPLNNEGFVNNTDRAIFFNPLKDVEGVDYYLVSYFK